MSIDLLASQGSGAESGTDEISFGATVFREMETDLVISGREIVADDVVALTLSNPEGSELAAWTPGAHIDLVLDETLTRQYSLCGSPQDRSTWRVGVLRVPDSRGGSLAVHNNLAVGSTIRVRGPRNHFTLLDAPRYLFIAGGIGITPLLPMIASAERRGIPWTLQYGGRRRTSMAFLDELAAYGDKVQLWPQDERGGLDLPAILGQPQADTAVYCCGPEGLLGAVESHCAAWPAGSLHLERFSPKAAEVPAGGDQPFELVLQRTGLTTVVQANQSILEVVEKAGITVLSSCRVGTCGTCEQAVVSGELDHRDSVLSEEDREAGEYMLICVSRCRSQSLVLDL